MVTGIKIVTVGDGASMEKGHKWSAWNVSLCGGSGFGVHICEKSSSCKLKIRDRNWMYAILWGEKNLALKHFILNTDLRHYVPILIPSLSTTTARRGSHGLPNTFKRACRKTGYDLTVHLYPPECIYSESSRTPSTWSQTTLDSFYYFLEATSSFHHDSTCQVLQEILL